MKAYLFKRLLLMIPTLLGVVLITFLIIQFVPGGPVEQLVQTLKQSAGGMEAANQGKSLAVSPEEMLRLKALYGFDKPPLERFIQLLQQLAVFDLGESHYYHASVWQLIKDRLPVSMSLGLTTFFLTYFISIPLGIRRALKEGTPFDRLTGALFTLGYAIPGFVLGLGLLVLFAGGSFWQIFPLRGLTSEGWDTLSLGSKIVDVIWHLMLPVTAMLIGNLAVTTQLTRNTFLDEIHKQYVLTARAKGLSERAIVWKHLLKNALIPLITGFPAAFIAAFFTGSLLIETLFSLEGIGLLSYEAIMKRDYPVVIGTLYFFTLLGLIGKLLSDLAYAWIDPRLDFGQEEKK